MSKKYVDYTNQMIITIPDHFINVQTGDIQYVSKAIQSQLQYHNKNNTLSHLIFSALHQYVHNESKSVPPQGGSNDMMNELLEIKKMLQQGNLKVEKKYTPTTNERRSNDIDYEEVEDVLEAFGG